MLIEADEKTGQTDALNQTESMMVTERVDDVALLLGQMIRMGLVEVLDAHLSRHWKQRGLSWGWTAVIWLAYILSEGDHRKVAMETYVKGMRETLRQVSGQPIEVLDFSDDRLEVLLRYLSDAGDWRAIEQELTQRSIEVYDLPTEVIRCDATTVSGYHEVVEEGLLQRGHSKDDPNRAQIKLMTGALDPLGMPLAADVVSGERADDGLYLPLIERLEATLPGPGLLFVGDCKMSALDIRAHLADHQQYYLSPLPLTGATAEQMPGWIDQGVAKDRAGELDPVVRNNAQDEPVLIAKGYEWERVGMREAAGEHLTWPERVLVVNSPVHAEQQAAGLEKRLTHAEAQLHQLTPPRGRGKRQITDEARLKQAIGQVLKRQRVEGLLSVAYEKQTEQRLQYRGRGRGAAHRDRQVIETVRYQITAVERQAGPITALKQRFGWKAFVTNVPQSQLSLSDAVRCYRREYHVERIFNRLKSRLQIAPLFVTRNDQVQGLTHLLMLGVRVLTLVEFTVRRSLQQDQTQLAELYPENRHKRTATPTAERLLKTFSGISLTILKDAAGREVRRWLTPLSAVQQDILQRLGLEVALYRQLGIQNTANSLSEW